LGEIIVTLQTPDGGILEALKRSRHSSRLRKATPPKEPTAKILEYKDMEPFFVKGESDEP